MGKGIGFNRNILLPWLEAAAAFRVQADAQESIRGRLEAVVGADIESSENRRKAVDILINIWVRSRDISPALYDEAVARFATTHASDERLWLHYGLVLLTYPFFRDAVTVIGQLARQGEPVTAGAVRRRLVASRGGLGSLGKAAERVVFSLRDWGLLGDSELHNTYTPRCGMLRTADLGLEAWLLACSLRAHPAESIPLPDLLRLPELFSFRFSTEPDQLRRSAHFRVDRQGGGWDSVRLAESAGAVQKARR